MSFDPGIAIFVQRLKEGVNALGKPITPTDRRDLLAVRGKEFPFQPFEDLETTNTFVVVPGREILVRIFRPKAPPKKRLPLIMYFHGGGFVAGDLDTHNFLTSLLASRCGAVVVSVHYRRAPENPFPAAIDDCDCATRWAINNAAKLGIDSHKVVLAGDSAGGALAASLAIRYRDRGFPDVLCQLLLYPVLDNDFDRPSYRRAADPFLTRESMIYYISAYLPGDVDLSNPEAIPMRVKSTRGLAPAYILIADHDVLRDEAVEYGRRLVEGGVPTTVREWPGTIHGFIRAQDLSAVSRQALDDLVKYLTTAFA